MYRPIQSKRVCFGWKVWRRKPLKPCAASVLKLSRAKSLVLQARTEAANQHCFAHWHIFFLRMKAVLICMAIPFRCWPLVLDSRMRWQDVRISCCQVCCLDSARKKYRNVWMTSSNLPDWVNLLICRCVPIQAVCIPSSHFLLRPFLKQISCWLMRYLV